jgi:hypothetical protein
MHVNRARSPLPNGFGVTFAARSIRRMVRSTTSLPGYPTYVAATRPFASRITTVGTCATTKARLTRHPLFGALEELRFASVLSWCEAA